MALAGAVCASTNRPAGHGTTEVFIGNLLRIRLRFTKDIDDVAKQNRVGHELFEELAFDRFHEIHIQQ